MENGFKSLVVWQKSMKLVEEVYALVDRFPAREKYALADQMRRAAISIPSNIAEGSRRGSKKDYAHFISIAHGSLSELETQLLLSKKLYPRFPYSQSEGLIDEISRMLLVLGRRLRD